MSWFGVLKADTALINNPQCSVTYKTQIDYDLQSLMSYNNMLHTDDDHYQMYDSVQDNLPHLPLKSISVKGHYRYV